MVKINLEEVPYSELFLKSEKFNNVFFNNVLFNSVFFAAFFLSFFPGNPGLAWSINMS